MATNHDAAINFDEDTGVATIELGGLHDLIAFAHQYDPNDGDGCRTIERYELKRTVEDGMNDEEFAAAQQIVNEINEIVQKMRDLDLRFHELFDCR